jgi:hypothetical protein
MGDADGITEGQGTLLVEGFSLSESREYQKESELNQFRWFADHCACVPRGAWKQPDPPEPDIVVVGVAASLGIELTELHPGGIVLRRLESEQRGITLAAGVRYRELGLPSLGVYVYWDEQRPITRHDREPLAAALVQFVCGNLPPPGQKVEYERLGRPSEPLPPHINRVRIDRSFEYEQNHWVVPHAAIVPHCTSEEVQARINAKEKRIAHYRERYSEHWLLVVAGTAGPSTWGEVTAKTRDHTYQAGFDRVFLMVLGQPEIVALRLDRSASSSTG